jgi:hypothetical protein
LSDQLETDNQLMAHRLEQLKSSLKKQKEERSSRGKGVIWRSGAPAGSLNKHAIKVLEKNPHRRRPQLPGSGKHKPAPPPPAGAVGPTSSGGRRPSPPNAMPAFEAAEQHDLLSKYREAAPPPAPSVNNPEDMVELTGAESDTAPLSEQDGSGESFDEDAGHQGFLDALNSWRTGVPAGSPGKQQNPTTDTTVNTNNPNPVEGCRNTSNSFHTCTDHCAAVVQYGLLPASTAVAGGAAAAAAASFSTENTITARQWQPAEASSLLDGPDYNEAASAAAFRAAVQAWRTGEPEEPVTVAPPPRKAPNVWIPPADPTEVASFECQTDALSTRPTTAANTTIQFKTTTTLTYMEKLMLARNRKNPTAVDRVDRGKSGTDNARFGGASPTKAAGPTAPAPGVCDPEDWLAPLGNASTDELTNASTCQAFEVTEVTDDDDAEDVGREESTPCVVEEPSDSSDDAGSHQYLERPSTGRKIQITPEYGHDSEGADDEAEYDVSEVVEVWNSEGAMTFEEVQTTPTRPLAAAAVAMLDGDATPRAAPRVASTDTVEDSSSDDSEADELAAAEFAASMAAASTTAAVAGMSHLELDDDSDE